MKIAKVILNVLLTVFLIIALLVSAGALITKLTGKSIFPYRVVWVLTDSMEPTVPAQSFILIKNADGSDVREGDIITFYSDDPTLKGELNTHRVHEIDEDGNFVTKGDNNASCDLYSAKPNNVIGIYVCNLTAITLIGRFFTTQYGLIFSFIVIFIAASVALRQIIRNEKKRLFDARVQAEVERLQAEQKKQQEGR